MRYLETDYIINSTDYAFGEVNSSGEFCGTCLIAKSPLSSGCFTFYENVSNMYTGFKMSRYSTYSGGKIYWSASNKCSKGPFAGSTVSINGDYSDQLDVRFEDDRRMVFQTLIKDKEFRIDVLPDSMFKAFSVTFKDKKVMVKRFAFDGIYEKVICDNLPFGFCYRTELLTLSELETHKGIYSDYDDDWMVCRQKNAYLDFSSYGFSRWSDGDFYMGKYWYDEGRTGLGCYRWPNGNEFIGRFYHNQVGGLGVFIRKNLCEIGVFDSEKKKKGVVVEYDKSKPNIITIKHYDQFEKQYGVYIELDIEATKLVLVTPNVGRKTYDL